jgi:hypothetical protein
MSAPPEDTTARPPEKRSETPPSGRTPENDLRARERQEGWAVPLDRIDAFTMGAALSVEPDRIQQELLGLWRKAAERAQREGARFAVARACRWNLVVHADGEEEFHTSKRLLDEVCETVPARVLLLHETAQEDPDGLVGDDGAPLRAFIEANIRRTSAGRREVVAEEITLEAARSQSQRLTGLVRALLLPDVPAALVVRNPITDSPWLPRIAPEVDRFVFDSGVLTSGAQLAEAAAIIGRLFSQGPRGAQATRPGDPGEPGESGELWGVKPVEIADLGWLRLWPWRALIASLFDADNDAAALHRLDHIEIRHARGAAPAALLLCGWLMDRLRLRPAGPLAGESATLRRRGQEAGGRRRAPDPGVRLRLIEEAHGTGEAGEAGEAGDGQDGQDGLKGRPAGGPVGLLSVSLSAGGATYTALGGVSDESRCVTLRAPTGVERVQPVHGRRDAELMVAAMGVGGRDPLMYEALRLGAALLHDPHRSLPKAEPRAEPQGAADRAQSEPQKVPAVDDQAGQQRGKAPSHT